MEQEMSSKSSINPIRFNKVKSNTAFEVIIKALAWSWMHFYGKFKQQHNFLIIFLLISLTPLFNQQYMTMKNKNIVFCNIIPIIGLVMKQKNLFSNRFSPIENIYYDFVTWYWLFKSRCMGTLNFNESFMNHFQLP